jgi:hypothetical protein
VTGGREIDVKGLCTMAVVVLCGVAAILVVVILIGGSNDVESKSFSFAFVFALYTLPAAAGVYLARTRPGLRLLGALTTLAALAAFVAIIAALWHGNDVLEGNGGDWKTAAILTLISIGSGQGSLILALGRPDDTQLVAGLRWAGLLPIAALTIIGAEDVTHRGPSVKTYAILGILYVLGVVLPPLVERATRPEETAEEPVSY